MQLCKLAARVIARHRGLLALYVLMPAAFGGLMASYAGTDDAAYRQTRPTVAVIDRDGSTISEAIAAFVSEAGTPVERADTTYALQDAAAKDLATYVLVIPEGYGEELADAARSDVEPPALECSVSFQNAQGSLMDERVRVFAQQLYALLQVGDTTAEQAVAWAEDAQAARAEVALTPQQATGLPLAHLIFMQFSTYALFGGTAILIASGGCARWPGTGPCTRGSARRACRTRRARRSWRLPALAWGLRCGRRWPRWVLSGARRRWLGSTWRSWRSRR